MKRSSRGFTLIELLVVIAIMAILLSIAISTYSGAQKSGRLAKRITDLKNIETALHLYQSENGIYPITASPRSECALGGSLNADQVIPGLVPKYLKIFPSDPRMDKENNVSCYIYISNSGGTAYKIVGYKIADFSTEDYLKQKALIDSARDGGENPCWVDGESPEAWALYSYEGCAF